jgi:hypothetical protein
MTKKATAKKKKAPSPAPATARFSHLESSRYSAIQSLAIKYYSSEVNGGWFACVARAREEVDGHS